MNVGVAALAVYPFRSPQWSALMTKFGICLAFASLINLIIPVRNSFAEHNIVTLLRTGSQPVVIRDIALDADGVLTGSYDNVDAQVVDGKLVAANGSMIKFRTDSAGSFKVNGVAGGRHRLLLGKHVIPLRLWKYGTAPPSAAPVLNLSDDHLVQRGQQPLGCCLPSGEVFLIGMLLAAAIAIPIAVHDSGDDGNGS